MEVAARTIEDLEKEAQRFAGTLSKKAEGATLVTLSGELGAGKTAFTKALAHAFGIDETVTSPTFVIEKIYQLPKGKPFKRLAHIDAYRLKSGIELMPLGFNELAQDSDTLIVLEWPECVSGALPMPDHEITFALVDAVEGARTIIYG